jgi:hypothetical protein
MKRIIKMAAMAAISGIVSASLVHGQSNLGAGGKSSSVTIDSSQGNYPDGSKWPVPQYEKPKTELSLRVEEMVHGGAVSPTASSKIQAELPAEITLGSAKAFRFSRVRGSRMALRPQTVPCRKCLQSRPR